jgi:hypothetical protein
MVIKQEHPSETREKYNSFQSRIPVMKDGMKTVTTERMGGGKGGPPIKIENIRVTVDINLPTPTKVYLTKNLFYFPPASTEPGIKNGGADSKYPLFTFDVKYSTDRLKSLGSHREQIACFFNEALFRRILEDQQQAIDDNDRAENAKYNVMFMLGCMFPTYFPIEGNLQGSFETKIEKNYFTNNDFIFPNAQFSYIRLVGGFYTVTRAIWINDIVNNKSYRKMLDSLIEYNRWEFKKKEELETKIKSIKKQLDESNKKLPTGEISNVFDTIIGKKTRTGYIETIIGKIKTNIDKLKGATDGDLIKLLIDISKNLKIMLKLVRNSYLSNDENVQALEKLIEIAKQLQSEKNILEILENPEKKKLFEKDTKDKNNREVLDKLSEYTNLSKIITEIRKYGTPYRVSSNNQLQTLIENFINGKFAIDRNLRDFVSHVNSVFFSKKGVDAGTYSKELLHTGVSLTNLPYVNKKTGKLVQKQRNLDIGVQLNVFKGILTSSNIECIHRNAVLESTYKHLKESGGDSNNVELEDQSHLFLDMTNLLEKGKKGGKTNKRRGDYRNNRTRRSY